MFEQIQFSVPLYIVVSASVTIGALLVASVALAALACKAYKRTRTQILTSNKKRFDLAEVLHKEAARERRTTFQS